MMAWVGTLAVALPALIVAWVAGSCLRRWAPTWGWVDVPGGRKDHRRPVALGGGIAIWLGIAVPIGLLWAGGQWPLSVATQDFAAANHAVWAAHAGEILLFLLFGSLFLLIGLADDLWGVPWYIRLFLEVVVAALAVVMGEWQLTLYLPGIFSVPLSILWIVGLVNAFNMLDNMDALSAGTATISCLSLVVICLWGPHPETTHPQWIMAAAAGIVGGACGGYLIHNAPPARLFMGDAGSYLVGFCLAVITMKISYAGYAPGTWHAVLAPALLMAVPWYDMASVIVLRWRAGRSPFEADHRHLSHRLAAMGMTRRRAVSIVHLLTATCGIAAVLLHRVDGVGAWLLLGLVACVLAVVALLEPGSREPERLDSGALEPGRREPGSQTT